MKGMFNKMQCEICPRQCKKSRKNHEGICSSGSLPNVARAALHFGEEPCISGQHGSGTIFFTGCSLRCIFCQNSQISRSADLGKTISIERLSEIMLNLEAAGAHNINLVTPTHFSQSILAALENVTLKIPVIYNCSGYELIKTLKTLNGKISIYMPDMKYSLDTLAEKYSSAPDYVNIAKSAIKEMYSQTGPYVLDENGIMQSGVLIRHLVLPGNLENTFGVIDWVANTFPKGSVLFSLLGQYTPIPYLSLPSELNRCVSKREYKRAENYLYASGIEDGFVQELSSANTEQIPSFDLTGV